jgi:hypothetical protein
MMFDTKNNMWELVMNYHTLIGSKISETGLDIYGTEQKLNMALSLTIAHQLQRLTEAIKEQTKKGSK